MKIFLPNHPEELAGAAAAQTSSPFSVFLPLAKTQVYQAGHCQIEIQELKSELFSVAVFEAVADAVQQVEICSIDPLLSLVFTLENRLAIQQTLRPAIVQEAGQHAMFYWPADEKLAVTVFPGRTVIFRVDYPAGMLRGLAEDCPDLRALLKSVQQHSVFGRQLPGSAMDAFIRWNIRQIFEYGHSQSERGLFIHSRSMDLLRCYIHSFHAGRRRAPDDIHNIGSRLADIVDFINQHLDAPLSKTSLARAHAMSVRSLERYFGLYYHESIGKFILQRRMLKAKELLAETTLPVLHVAILVGYSELPNFTRAFRSHYGFPPTHLRR